MPENPKLFRKKSKVRTWFNVLARETVAGDYLPQSELIAGSQQQSSAVASVTVDQFQGYPTLPSDEQLQQPNPT